MVDCLVSLLRTVESKRERQDMPFESVTQGFKGRVPLVRQVKATGQRRSVFFGDTPTDPSKRASHFG